MTVRTRFAPSPTGYLHIGGARTALFAWAWARQQQGEFVLRIEDTDTARSSAAHSDAIIRAMQWLELDIDGVPRFQSARRARHVEIAKQLLAARRAYHCYCTAAELEQMRAAQLTRGESPRYDRRWRDSNEKPPPDLSPAIRLKIPLAGESRFVDAVKGDMRIDNAELDDLVLLRADGLPTYNLANVADDIDEGITHVIRGDDHVMNTFRQLHVYKALGKTPPIFAHLPMILSAVKDESGNIVLDDNDEPRYERMSKRNAAVDVGQYERDGFLPAALINYLARLSWSCGDTEIFSRDFLVKHFNFSAVQRSPARFDIDKLRWINSEYLHALPPASLREGEFAAVDEEVIKVVQPRANTLVELREEVSYFIARPTLVADMLAVHCGNQALLQDVHMRLAALPEWNADVIKKAIKQTAKDNKVNFSEIGMPMRMLLTGRIKSPDIALVAALLGRDETLIRLDARS